MKISAMITSSIRDLRQLAFVTVSLYGVAVKGSLGKSDSARLGGPYADSTFFRAMPYCAWSAGAHALLRQAVMMSPRVLRRPTFGPGWVRRRTEA